MWGSQSPHETDWSHDPRGRGLETPINTHCKLLNIFFVVTMTKYLGPELHVIVCNANTVICMECDHTVLQSYCYHLLVS